MPMVQLLGCNIGYYCGTGDELLLSIKVHMIIKATHEDHKEEITQKVQMCNVTNGAECLLTISSLFILTDSSFRIVL